MGLIRNLVSRLSGDGGNVRRSSSSGSSDGGRDGRRERRRERKEHNRRSDGGGSSRAAAPQQAIRVDEQLVNRDAMANAYALLEAAVQVARDSMPTRNESGAPLRPYRPSHYKRQRCCIPYPLHS